MTAKISDLTAVASSASTDLYEIETAGGASKKATAAQLLTYIEGAIGTAAFRALIDDASSAALLTTLGGQPLDSDLTAIAALGTTPYGRALLTKGDAAELRTAGGLVIGTDVAAIASPTFTGTPAAPTAALATNTTQLATTAFVLANASGAPTTAKYITTASDAGLSAEIVIPSLGASADRAGIGGGGITEEYDTGSSGLTWGTNPGTEDSNSTYASHLYTRWVATVAESLGTRAWAPGSGAFDARVQLSHGVNATSGTYAPGFHIGDSGNSNRLLINAALNAASGVITLNAYTYASGSYTPRGNTNTLNVLTPLYLRIARDGSNNVSYYYSINGLTWQLIATQAFTLTVSNIGYRVNTPATSEFILISDWLRTNV